MWLDGQMGHLEGPGKSRSARHLIGTLYNLIDLSLHHPLTVSSGRATGLVGPVLTRPLFWGVGLPLLCDILVMCPTYLLN